MANRNIAACYREFEESYRSEATNTGTAACRTDVRITHKDTLGRKLPAGIRVKVFDQDGGVYYGVIDGNGHSHHAGVKCGDICWQLMKGAKANCEPAPTYQHSNEDKRRLQEKDEQAMLNDCDGYVLIKANEETTKDPRLQLSSPLKVFVSVNEPKVKAVYLPPPILLNLRFRQNTKAGLLSELQIGQLIQDNKTATLFIHGYNVPLGNMGQFVEAEALGERPLPSNLPRGEEIQRPYLYYTDEIVARSAQHIVAQKLFFGEDTGDNPPVKQAYKEADNRLNGTKALSWFPHVEYYLNLAASGKQTPEANLSAEDWEKYSRIIGVTWSGSVTPSLVFFRAEMYANEAGRELAKVLIQLIEAEIRINIITHSLGARVALSALNILGDFDGKYNEKVDNLIMWEAAVADNAMTDTYTRAKNPVAMELFPFAHKAVKRMRILYSQEDGVLDGDSRGGDAEYTGLLGGAYPKKYTSLANTTGALKDYYYKQNKIGDYYTDFENLRRDYLLHRGSLNQDDIAQYENMANTAKGREIKRSIEKLLLEEANTVSSDLNKPLNYLKPWSHFRRFRPDDEYFKHIVEVLTSQVFNNWTIYTKDMAVRPALGHAGEKFVAPAQEQRINNQQAKNYPIDKFILGSKNKKFFFFDQSVTEEENKKRYYFISHSAMREYEWAALDTFKPKIFPDVYEYSYRREIINRIKENSHFGRYKK